jgi:hypothetical protein
LRGNEYAALRHVARNRLGGKRASAVHSEHEATNLSGAASRLGTQLAGAAAAANCWQASCLTRWSAPAASSLVPLAC